MKKTLINILGTGRSGSTMLDLMMGNDEESFSMGEVYPLFRPYHKSHFTIDCNCGDPQCPYWTKLIKLKETALYVKAFEIIDVKYLIDSSKALPWFMDSCESLKKQDIQVINFLIYKPFLSYSYSKWKRGDDIEKALDEYKTYPKRFFQSGLDAYAISFDELVNNPDNTLQRLCEITGQEYTENRKAFWTKKHHHLFGSAGTRKQARKGESHIRTTEEYPEEFKKIIPEINALIEKDKDLNKIQRGLDEIDFKKQRNKPQNHQSKLIKPLWYYGSKVKNKWRSKFPI